MSPWRSLAMMALGASVIVLVVAGNRDWALALAYIAIVGYVMAAERIGRA